MKNAKKYNPQVDPQGRPEIALDGWATTAQQVEKDDDLAVHLMSDAQRSPKRCPRLAVVSLHQKEMGSGTARISA